ncbi:MAG: SelB C-terminal domain-containing protein, partial [Chloroflexi bacterium]|nr:SelB C-terminal domain-containing protein [Chloroflexota bacterium]
LAGVGGIDIALLVVAADEGVMPQTREHLAILDLLQVRTGVVAITKADLVGADWLELVQADVAETLDGTSLAGAPLIPCSAVTREGLPELLAALEAALAQTEAKRDIGRPRLAIDRVFTVSGFGTVVTGTLIDGEMHLGQELEVQPGGLRSRVRGLQSHRKKLENVPAGTRTAINLTGLSVDDLRRGQVLAAPGSLKPTRAVDARLRLIRDGHPVKHNTEVSFHTGAAETLGKLALLDRDELRPGEEAWVQVRLQDEVALARGDLFVLRLPSPSRTIGGGTVVESHAKRHRRRQQSILEQLEVLAEGSPEDIVLDRLRAREPSDVEGLVARSGLPAAEVRAAVGRLLAADDVLLVDGPNGSARVDARAFVVTREGWQRLSEQVRAILSGFHASYPLRRGLPKEELRTRVGADPRLFVRELERLKADAVATEDGPFVRLVSHTVAFSPAQESQLAALLDVLREAGVSPPDRADLEAELRISSEVVDAAIADGRLVEVAAGLVYDRATLDDIVARIRAEIQAHGPRTVAQIRDLLDASRKYTLALVTYTDEHKITRRVGDERVLY